MRKLVYRPRALSTGHDREHAQRDEHVLVRYYEKICVKDKHGVTLWELKIGGEFHIIENLKVVKVIDETTIWTNVKLGWTYRILWRCIREGYSTGKIAYELLLQGPKRSLRITACVIVNKRLSKYSDIIIVSL